MCCLCWEGERVRGCFRGMLSLTETDDKEGMPRMCSMTPADSHDPDPQHNTGNQIPISPTAHLFLWPIAAQQITHTGGQSHKSQMALPWTAAYQEQDNPQINQWQHWEFFTADHTVFGSFWKGNNSRKLSGHFWIDPLMQRKLSRNHYLDIRHFRI